jgi:putative ABC transport system ATP-binding protein
VALDGTPWTSLSDGQRRALRIARVGLVFQEFELLDPLSVLENVLLPYHAHPKLKLDASVVERARGLLEATGIEQLASKRPRSLSQGERQRVAICRALVTEPSLVLADEPTGNLDPVSAKKVVDLLFAARDRGATLAFVTHDHGLLERFDRHVDFAAWGSRMGLPVGGGPA